MAGSCWAYDSSTHPEVRAFLEKKVKAVDAQSCFIEDSKGMRCDGVDCNFGDMSGKHGRRRKPDSTQGGSGRRGLRRGRRRMVRPFALGTPHQAGMLPPRPGAAAKRKRPRR